MHLRVVFAISKLDDASSPNHLETWSRFRCPDKYPSKSGLIPVHTHTSRNVSSRKEFFTTGCSRTAPKSSEEQGLLKDRCKVSYHELTRPHDQRIRIYNMVVQSFLHNESLWMSGSDAAIHCARGSRGWHSTTYGCCISDIDVGRLR
jgi:hypothetical protein